MPRASQQQGMCFRGIPHTCYPSRGAAFHMGGGDASPCCGLPGAADRGQQGSSASPWLTPHHTNCKGASVKGFATNISSSKCATGKGLKVRWEYKN